MEIVSNKDEMVFRKDYEGRPIYSIGLSRKDKNGEYVKGYITANFREGVDIKNGSRIKINNAWLSFYKKENMTIPTIFVSDFELTSEPKPKEETNPFEDFGNSIKTESNFEQINITDEDLPF